MGDKYLREKKLTMAQQAYGLKTMYPGSRCQWRGNHLNWTGAIVPTPLSASYTVRIVYEQGFSPKTYVHEPKLAVVPGEKLPHVYDESEQRLCLYYPGARPEWTASLSIANTIVPWASEWLFFYEIWLATGEWLGGGIHLGTRKEEPK